MGPLDGRQVPKQYLPLAGRPMLVWTLEALATAAPAAILLMVAPQDRFELDAGMLPASLERIADGGASRAETVMAGLRALAGRAAPDDPVLVHDAARPCLAPELLGRLIETLAADPDGGLLALPVVDTIKAAGGEPPRVAATRDRAGLWLAQTPQLFPYDRLYRALDRALAAGAAGLAREALEVSVTYAKEREQFGAPIASKQLVQELLAAMHVDIQACKGLLDEVVAKKLAGERCTLEVSTAKLFCTEASVRCADRAVQVHGGYGYIDEYPVQRMLRDARVTTLYEGTSQVQHLIIGRLITGENAF
jgi:2-C-methyl-D-erythritol 4-phosphate cytidylyltransferase